MRIHMNESLFHTHSFFKSSNSFRSTVASKVWMRKCPQRHIQTSAHLFHARLFFRSSDSLGSIASLHIRINRHPDLYIHTNAVLSMVDLHLGVKRRRVCPHMQMHLFSMPIHSRLGCFHSLFTHRVNRPPGLLIHANVHLSMVYHASSLPIRLFHVNICPQLDLCIKQLREFSMAVHLLNIALSCFHSDLVHLCE